VFDNMQFVNYTNLMQRHHVHGLAPNRLEASFALQALMEVPVQYQVGSATRSRRLIFRMQCCILA
jgi:hypothetical protein